MTSKTVDNIYASAGFTLFFIVLAFTISMIMYEYNLTKNKKLLQKVSVYVIFGLFLIFIMLLIVAKLIK